MPEWVLSQLENFAIDSLEWSQINTRDSFTEYEFSWAHLAVIARNGILMRHVVEVEPKLIEARDGQGNTPLHLAAFNNDFEVARTLLRAGASLCAQNEGGLAPFELVPLQGSLDLFKLLHVPLRKPPCSLTGLQLAFVAQRSQILDWAFKQGLG